MFKEKMWPNLTHYASIFWRDWGNPRKLSVSVVGIWVDIWSLGHPENEAGVLLIWLQRNDSTTGEEYRDVSCRQNDKNERELWGVGGGRIRRLPPFFKWRRCKHTTLLDTFALSL